MHKSTVEIGIRMPNTQVLNGAALIWSTLNDWVRSSTGGVVGTIFTPTNALLLEKMFRREVELGLGSVLMLPEVYPCVV